MLSNGTGMIRDDGTRPADRGFAPYVPSLGAEIEVAGVLNGLVVVSVGRGSPVQEAVNRALKAAGAVVLVKTAMADVVRMLGAFVPSVVVIEVVPGDDEALRILREILQLPAERGGWLPVIGVSWEAPDPATILSAGFHGALVGPFDAVDVARTVLRAVRQRA